MAYSSDQARDDRIKKLEGFREGWDEMIRTNNDYLEHLNTLKRAGCDDFDEAILRATDAGKQLAAAKQNIEAAIARVRDGGR